MQAKQRAQQRDQPSTTTTTSVLPNTCFSICSKMKPVVFENRSTRAISDSVKKNTKISQICVSWNLTGGLGSKCCSQSSLWNCRWASSYIIYIWIIKRLEISWMSHLKVGNRRWSISLALTNMCQAIVKAHQRSGGSWIIKGIKSGRQKRDKKTRIYH